LPRIEAATPEMVLEAARRLKAGGTVAIATETVYGLFCDSMNEAALSAVYAMKGRPASNPLIAHVLDAAMAKRTTFGFDARAEKLAAKFWPGPLAIVLPRRPEIAAIGVGGRGTVAVRAPSHPVALAVIAAFGGPLSAPSANRSGRISPTTPQHVAEEFKNFDDLLILDGGVCSVGIESTVLDLSRARPIVLRPGAIGEADLTPILGTVMMPHLTKQDASPGTMAKHYAPSIRCEVVQPDALATRLAKHEGKAAVLAQSSISIPSPHAHIEMPNDPAAYAQRFYAALREADHADATLVLIVVPAERDGLWVALHDRIRRAGA
jgi:L-threonylcarbamoyladenylate synthase